MGDPPPRMVDPTVLLPVVLLVVAEFSTLAREYDPRESLREGRRMPVVDFAVYGALTYPTVVSLVLRRATVPILRPVVSRVRDLTGWNLSPPERPPLPGEIGDRLGDVRGVLEPNFGQFGLIHLTNTGLLLFTFYATVVNTAGSELSFVQYLLVFVIVLLPFLEFKQYEPVKASVDPMYSFAVHLGVNAGIVILALRTPPSFLQPVLGVSPLIELPTYVAWWLAAGYLYLVVLAVDIRRAEANR